MNSRTISIFLGILISGFLIWLLVRGIDFDKMASALASADYIWLLPNVVLIVFSMFLRAWRWRYMLDPIAQVGSRPLLSATCIGFMANNVLPLRLGEFARAYSLSAQEPQVSKSATLATVFVERMVFDLVALLVIFEAVAIGAHSAVDTRLQSGALIAGGVGLVGVMIVIALVLRPETVGARVARFVPFANDKVRAIVSDTVRKFSQGVVFIRDPKKLWPVILYTAVIWLLMGISNYFVFLAFHFSLPLSASFVLLVMVSISILIPSSPGFVGVYHAAAAYTLSLYGVSAEHALSFSVVLHLAQYIPITALGLYFLKTQHLSLGGLQRAAQSDT